MLSHLTMSKKTPRNFVAKHSAEFNKPKVFRDRKKEYKRREKFADYEHETPEHKPYSRYGKENKRLIENDEYEEDEDKFEEDEEEWFLLAGLELQGITS